jgi:hypothetical protein
VPEVRPAAKLHIRRHVNGPEDIDWHRQSVESRHMDGLYRIASPGFRAVLRGANRSLITKTGGYCLPTCAIADSRGYLSLNIQDGWGTVRAT